MAFALAASVSNEVHFWPAQVGLYGAATLTGWSRINDNKHWLSDVLGGAAVGITSANDHGRAMDHLRIGPAAFPGQHRRASSVELQLSDPAS